jgi:hypothetical protein
MKLLSWRTLSLALVLAALQGQPAFANGTPRYVLEGNIKVRFYYDTAFYANQFWNYNDLQGQLLSSLNYTGQYALGLKFVQDTSNFNFLVDMGGQQVWSRVQTEAFMDWFLPFEPGIVKVLIHFRGMTPDGICHEDVPGDNFFSRDEGITWRNPPTGGTASAQVVVTAKAGCSVNSAAVKSFSDLRETFVHEMGHAVGHNGTAPPAAQCTTRPAGSVMCHNVSSGVRRSWQKWFSADVTAIRTDVFDSSSRRFPLVACYEWTSYQACNDQCLNTAGFPNPGATEVYENCLAATCAHMCK